MDYCSKIKSNDPLIHAKIWINLNIIITSERRFKKCIYCMNPFKENPRKCKLIYSDRKQISSCLRTGDE